MTFANISLLVVVGFLGGGINSIAGGGSLVVFPAMLAVGLSPLQANVTNSVAQWPGYIGGVIGFRRELADQKVRLLRTLPAAVLGSALGCVLLLVLPGKAFDTIVPALVIAASILLAFQPRLTRWANRRQSDQTVARVERPVWTTVAVFGGAVYGGYFGGALGVILVAVLAFSIPDPLRKINALKTAVSMVVATVTVVAFGLFGPVDWLVAAVTAPAALIGGIVGARVARRVPDIVLRVLVVMLGLAVGVYLVIRAIRGG